MTKRYTMYMLQSNCREQLYMLIRGQSIMPATKGNFDSSITLNRYLEAILNAWAYIIIGVTQVNKTHMQAHIRRYVAANMGMYKYQGHFFLFCLTLISFFFPPRRISSLYTLTYTYRSKFTALGCSNKHENVIYLQD